jgi:hypothetical protein
VPLFEIFFVCADIFISLVAALNYLAWQSLYMTPALVIAKCQHDQTRCVITF